MAKVELTEIRRDSIVDRIARPAALAADEGAYAIAIVGQSMWPRFRPGRYVAVSPGTPVAVGDDVVVTLRQGRALIKELVRRRNDGIELRQFTPDLTISVPADEVATIEKVMGEST